MIIKMMPPIPSHTSNIYIILVQPQMPENIGFCMRAMANFHLTRLRLVKPREDFPNPLALAVAKNSANLINVEIFSSLAEALADLDYAFALSGRQRDLNINHQEFQQGVTQGQAMLSKGKNIAYVFGPERSGLENHDILQCQTIISLPTNPSCPSLNLSHAVAITAYTLNQFHTPEKPDIKDFAPIASKQKLQEILLEKLETSKFYRNINKREQSIQDVQALIQKLDLNPKDVQLLIGIIKSLKPDQA